VDWLLKRIARNRQARSPCLEQRPHGAEDAKKLLTDLSKLKSWSSAGHTVRKILTRDNLEKIAEPLIARTLKRCELALADASSKPLMSTDRSGRRLTRMPIVRQRVAKMFHREPLFDRSDQVVALVRRSSFRANGNQGDMRCSTWCLVAGHRNHGGVMER